MQHDETRTTPVSRMPPHCATPAGSAGSWSSSSVGSKKKTVLKNAGLEGPILKFVQDVVATEISGLRAAIDLMLDRMTGKLREECEDHVRQCLNHDRGRFDEELASVRQEINQTVSMVKVGMTDLTNEFTNQWKQIHFQCEGLRSELDARCLDMTSRIVEREGALVGPQRDMIDLTSPRKEWADQLEVLRSEVRRQMQTVSTVKVGMTDLAHEFSNQRKELQFQCDGLRTELEARCLSMTSRIVERDAAHVGPERDLIDLASARKEWADQLEVLRTEVRRQMQEFECRLGSAVKRDLDTTVLHAHSTLSVGAELRSKMAKNLATMCSQFKVHIDKKPEQETAHNPTLKVEAFQTEMAVCAEKIAQVQMASTRF